MSEIFEIGLCNKFSQGSILHIIIGIVAVLLIGYLLGSLNFGVIISKVFYKDDVRNHGSGGSGATNMLRTYGKFPAVMTFLGDGIKTAVAVLVGALFLGIYNSTFYGYDGAFYSTEKEWGELVGILKPIYGEIMPDLKEMGVTTYNGFAGMYIGGIASLIGHAFPVYYGFKGGKCVASTFFLVLCTNPLIALVCLMFFVAIVWVTKFVSVGSIMCVVIYPLILYNWTGLGMHILAAVFIMLFVVFLHRGNIKRLINGKENKLNFGKKKEKT